MSSPLPPQGAPRGRLRRTLRLHEVTAGGVGIIIGAGIYVLVGDATERAGAAVWIGFAIAAVLSALTGLGYAELTSMYPRASSEFEYTRHAFPAWVAFVVGWVMTAALVVASAAVSIGFARYFVAFVPVPQPVASYGVLLTAMVIAMIGIRESVRLTLLLSAVQVAGLLLVIAVGLPHIGTYDLFEAPNGFRGIVGAAALVFFAFIGFDEVATLSEETDNPTWTIPRALLLALGISTALYMLVAVASVSVIGADALGRSERPLADVLAHDLGTNAGLLVSVIALVSTMNTTLLALTAASRMLYGMSSQGVLPAWLSHVHASRGTPIKATALATAIGAGFVQLGSLSLIASVTDFSIYLVFLAVNATVIILRFKEPRTPRPIRVPGAIGKVPVIPVLGFLAVAYMMTHIEVSAMQIGAAVAGLAVLASFLLGRRHST